MTVAAILAALGLAAGVAIVGVALRIAAPIVDRLLGGD